MTSPSEQAGQRIAAVEAAFEKANGAWTGVGVSVGSVFGVTPQDQVLGAIRSMQTLGYVPWAARAQTLKPTDQAGWDRWVADGNDMLKNLAGIAQDADVSSLPGIVAATAAATVVEAADKTSAAVKAVWDAKGIIVLGLVAVAVAVVVWKFR